MFWKIAAEDIILFEKFNSLEIQETLSFKKGKNGEYDKCHRDLTGKLDEGTESFAEQYCKPPHVFVCINNREHGIMPDQYKRLKAWVKEKGLSEQK